jgi:hypothetical protein
MAFGDFFFERSHVPSPPISGEKPAEAGSDVLTPSCDILSADGRFTRGRRPGLFAPHFPGHWSSTTR